MITLTQRKKTVHLQFDNSLLNDHEKESSF